MDANNTAVEPFYVYVYMWTKHAASMYLILSFLLGVPGNILVILVHINIKGKTVTDWMLFYIAVCDIMSLINVPFYILQFQGVWSRGVPDFFCKFHFLNLNSASVASYIFCACTAFERYFKVVRSKEMFSISVAKCIWMPVFVASFGLGLPILWAVANNPSGNCMFDTEKKGQLPLVTIEFIMISVVAFLTSIIIVICYIRTGVFLLVKMKEIAESSSSTSLSKSYKNTVQTTKMLAILTAVFLFSANVPYISGIYFTTYEPEDEPLMSIMMFLGLSFFINNFFNPFLYMGMSESFRRRVAALCCKCCRSKYLASEESNTTTVTQLSNRSQEQ